MSKVLSIEVGYSLTRICEMDFRSKSPKIYKFVSVNTPDGVFDDGFIKETPEFISSIRDALAVNKMKSKQVVFSVTSSKIATREVLLPMVKANQLDNMIRANLNDYLPIDPSGYEIAHMTLSQAKDDKGMDANRVLIMAADKRLVENYDAFARACGLHLISLDYSGNSIYQVMKQECKEETEMVIKVEEKSTIATIISNKKLMMQRNVAYGVDNAVEAVMSMPIFAAHRYYDALEVLKGKAIIKVVLNDYTRVIEKDENEMFENEKMKACRKEVTESLAPLVGNLSRVVDLYNSKNSDRPIRKVNLIGLGADISGFSKLLTNELGIKCVVVNSLKDLNINKMASVGNPGRYMAAMGAAIDPVGFVNEEKKKSDVNDVNYRNVAILSAILFILAAGVMWFVSAQKLESEETARGRLENLEKQYLPGEEKYNQMNDTIALYNEVRLGYNSTATPNDNLLQFLFELEQNLPKDAVVSEFISSQETAEISIRVESMAVAAKVLQNLREFDSLVDVKIGDLSYEAQEEAAEAIEEEIADAVSQITDALTDIADALENGEDITDMEEPYIKLPQCFTMRIICVYNPVTLLDDSAVEEVSANTVE